MAEHSFQVMLEWDSEDNVWVTYVPTLDFLSTYGETKKEAIANTREAISRLHGSCLERGYIDVLGHFRSRVGQY